MSRIIGFPRHLQCGFAVLLVAGHIVAGADGPALGADPADRIFTIANYPIEAAAKNAVAAKRQAITDGRRGAFRSLVKRLVPVTAYQRIKRLDALNPKNLVAGIAVRSERNSGTRYIANLDYSFSPKAVRQALRGQGVPFVDKTAPETTLVVLYRAPSAGASGVTSDMTAQSGADLWHGVWSDLDLTNTLTPLRLTKPRSSPDPKRLKLAASGDSDALKSLARSHRKPRVVLALAEPLPAKGHLNVVIAGTDGVGEFNLKRGYVIEPEDFGYSLELAAVISLGVLEGRWKAVNWRHSPSSAGARGFAGGRAAGEDVQLWVSFRNLGEWQRRRQLLSGINGVDELRTGDLSARGASVALRYPGGGRALRDALAQRGLTLESDNGTWILR